MAAWRGMRRGVVLLLALLVCWPRYALVWTRRGAGCPLSVHARAYWLHLCCRSVLKALGVGLRVEGELPTDRRGTLIVANHLSYLDIVIFGAATPCVFVAKEEVAGWPIFGALGTLGGTIFLDRESRVSAWDTAEAMDHRLADGAAVLMFPEGTSTDGSEVMRFHSTLFAPAVDAGLTVTPAAVFYEPKREGTERDLCWFGDETFLPHLLRVLCGHGFTAKVRFGVPERLPDRRTAAWRSHDAVEALRRSK